MNSNVVETKVVVVIVVVAVVVAVVVVVVVVVVAVDVVVVVLVLFLRGCGVRVVVVGVDVVAIVVVVAVVEVVVGGGHLQRPLSRFWALENQPAWRKTSTKKRHNNYTCLTQSGILQLSCHHPLQHQQQQQQ